MPELAQYHQRVGGVAASAALLLQGADLAVLARISIHRIHDVQGGDADAENVHSGPL